MAISVIIPSYRRTEELNKCLGALQRQERKPDEILVVAREGDEITITFLESAQKSCANLKVILVSAPGQVVALNAGLDKATGDIIAFTDDDAIPHPDWLKKIEERFAADPKIGGVGGKDILYVNGQFQSGNKKIVGRIQWCGRLVGNHHLGFGHAREVDTLKGSNMSFRRSSIERLKFDTRLRGEGAQVRNDTALCLAVKKAGWKLIYDPAIQIDHYMAVRHEENKRGNFSRRAVEDGAYNETLIIMEHLDLLRRIGYVLYFLLMGNIFTPGLLQCIRILPRERGNAFLRLFAAYQGRFEGLKTWIGEKK